MDAGFAEEISAFSQLPLQSVSIALLLACFFGGILGLERETRDKPAGLRTHILVSLAAAAFALLTRDYFQRAEAPEEAVFDVVRGVAGGGAVLAAGTIIAGKRSVRGLTTGAGMWLAAAVGLACG
ncbi:MAG: MgtC/SapB family protein, partial [Alphaproteobacteria bacterium]